MMGKLNGQSPPTTPICRCRVMYLGSAVPHVTKDGLQGIQEPLRDLYPESGAFANGANGIDSWLSVWSNGILVENVDDHGREVKRFYPIESLHYCAAVRYVMVPNTSSGVSNTSTLSPNTNNNNNSNTNNSPSTSTSSEKVAKFLPLDSPFSRHADASHPPLFACILRRTTGIKVLECHAFISKREAAANALVRCCFHAYADTIHAKQIDTESPYSQIDGRRSRSITALDSVEKVEQWRHKSTHSKTHDDPPEGEFSINGPNGDCIINDNGNGIDSTSRPHTPSATSIISHSPDDENYKVWTGQGPLEREVVYLGMDGSGTLRSMRSTAANSVASTMVRTPKPRQLAIPCAMPPPPPPPLPPPMNIVKDKKNKKKDNTLTKKQRIKGHMPPLPPMPPHLLPNGYPINHGINHGINFMSQPPAPPFPHPHPHHPHPHAIYAPSSSIYSEGRRLKRRPMPPLPPHLNHLPPEAFPPSMIFGHGDEPIYIPAMRPVTPMSNRHPPPLPPHNMEQGMIVQYGFPPPPPLNYGTNPRTLSHRESINEHKNKKKDKKKSSKIPSDADSPFNTGIYKKKGHLNERAFSYSIRQEHRSRSNSLTNLQFEQNGDSGHSGHNGQSLTNGHMHMVNGNSNHTDKNGYDSAITERKLSERLSRVEIKRNGIGKKVPPPPPPPPPQSGHRS